MAGQTKRPTSVVMVVGAVPQKKGKDGTIVEESKEAKEEWEETYKGLVKTVQREGQHVKV